MWRIEVHGLRSVTASHVEVKAPCREWNEN